MVALSGRIRLVRGRHIEIGGHGQVTGRLVQVRRHRPVPGQPFVEFAERGEPGGEKKEEGKPSTTEAPAKAGAPAKKSELLRAGLKLLAALPDAGFLAAVKAVPTLKTGRPAKD